MITFLQVYGDADVTVPVSEGFNLHFQPGAVFRAKTETPGLQLAQKVVDLIHHRHGP